MKEGKQAETVWVTGCMMLDDRDLRLNQPMILEDLSGEILYRQIRDRPLTDCPVTPDDFLSVNGPRRQMWTARLTLEEAQAVQAYRCRESRWMDLYYSDRPRLISEIGGAEAAKVDRMVRRMISAVSKSFTGRMVLRHYSRNVPPVFDRYLSRNGRICVSGSFLSCQTGNGAKPGYGNVEIRIVSMPGSGKGVFVTPPGDPEPEFVLPPGTAFRAVGDGRGAFCLEQVRMLGRSFDVQEAPSGSADPYATEYNEHLLAGCDLSGQVAAIWPPRTEGW